MSDRQIQIPGGPFFNDAEEASLYQRQIPGGPYINETQQGSNGYTLDAESGSVTITGTAAGLRASRTLVAGQGSVVVTGTAATLKASRVIDAESGEVLITGTDAILSTGYVLSAEEGLFEITGTPATLLVSRVLEAESGLVVITGTSAELVADDGGGGTNPFMRFTPYREASVDVRPLRAAAKLSPVGYVGVNAVRSQEISFAPVGACSRVGVVSVGSGSGAFIISVRAVHQLVVPDLGFGFGVEVVPIESISDLAECESGYGSEVAVMPVKAYHEVATPDVRAVRNPTDEQLARMVLDALAKARRR